MLVDVEGVFVDRTRLAAGMQLDIHRVHVLVLTERERESTHRFVRVAVGVVVPECLVVEGDGHVVSRGLGLRACLLQVDGDAAASDA